MERERDGEEWEVRETEESEEEGRVRVRHLYLMEEALEENVLCLLGVTDGGVACVIVHSLREQEGRRRWERGGEGRRSRGEGGGGQEGWG